MTKEFTITRNRMMFVKVLSKLGVINIDDLGKFWVAEINKYDDGFKKHIIELAVREMKQE